MTRILCGDAVDLARAFEPRGPTVVITDPVWPNRSEHLFPGVDAAALLRATLEQLVGKVSHIVLHVGCTTDPRFAAAVPDHWPFWRTCWLDYVMPVKRGQTLVGSDVAWVFGPTRYPHGARLAPGRSPPAGGHLGKGRKEHPCPRDLDHVRWLVRWFSKPGETVLDPFVGAGTTMVAAKEHGRDAEGWDNEPSYCALTERSLAQAQLLMPPPKLTLSPNRWASHPREVASDAA